MKESLLILKWPRLKNSMAMIVPGLIAFLLLPIPGAFAAFCLQYSLLYHTWEDDVDQFSYSRMNNAFFVGASFDRNNKLYIGPSYHMIAKTHQAGSGSTESEVSLTAFGASVLYFIDKEFRWKVQLTYDLALSGTRTVDGTNEDIEGSGYEAGIGFQLPLSRSVWLGATMNYHAFNISESKVDTTATDVSESYTAIVPMINLNFFFR
ncbi:MAG: outer membrane beta-barrel protein [Bdellovibrio sp.]|nr:outer membrane beta-barrel protein [Bdellovibrio sp.]